MPDGTRRLTALRTLALGVNWFDSGSGGLDRVFHDLVQALPAAGIDAHGLVLGPADVAGLTQGRVRALGVEGFSGLGKLRAVRRGVAAQVKTGGFDLVACHFAMCAAPALDALRHLPMVVHFHGPWADESAAEGGGRLGVAAKRLAERCVYGRAARVVTLSHAFAALAARRYDVAEARIRVVPGSVDLARFGTGLSRKEAAGLLGWPQDRRILISVRRLARRMGLDRLVAALAIVARAEPDVLLMIAGRGRLEAELTAQIEAAGLGRHVRLLGFLPDTLLPLAYRAAEINVVPTLALEGFGLTAAEALASGTPSVVADVGALPEVVGGLSPDLVLASTEPGAMAERLLAMLRGTVGLPDAQACRRYAEERFSPSRAAAATAGIYREVA